MLNADSNVPNLQKNSEKSNLEKRDAGEIDKQVQFFHFPRFLDEGKGLDGIQARMVGTENVDREMFARQETIFYLIQAVKSGGYKAPLQVQSMGKNKSFLELNPPKNIILCGSPMLKTLVIWSPTLYCS